MKLTKRDIADFKKLYKARFGVILDDTTARKRLSILVRQVELTYKPILREQLQSFNQR